MSEMTVSVERIDNGMEAAFVHFPHFRTHAARLTIGSGAMHEVEGNFGSAHFLEHVTFQGTEFMPSADAVNSFSDRHSLSRNAFTSRTETFFVSDGYDLKPSVGFIAELAFKPLLIDESLERERKPIDDELRGNESSPYYYSSLRHAVALRGPVAGRSVLGSHEDIASLTGDKLREFHARNYRVGNATLVICSAEPVEQQREVANNMFADILDSGNTLLPTLIAEPTFNPEKIHASIAQTGEPNARTNIDIVYDVPQPLDIYDRMAQSMVASILSQMMHRTLRSEMALCYGAGVNFSTSGGKHFGSTALWSEMSASVSLGGADALRALDAMQQVIHSPLPDHFVGATATQFRQTIDHILESPPGAIANYTRSKIAQTDRKKFSFDETMAFANMITPERLQKVRDSIISSRPLVLATGPDKAVLESIGEWAESRAVA